ncbi:hypothetical protein Mucpa_2353 [Mucilaginibacter paludis DSM 18603]|uniref:Uncharacterized protein n=2 Tax=Mucilaginibacter TaxID=423349 RepID=H1YI48_9SPHI|nr:hypothetical protein Mucpa_2353 [Mucilaginibacter paludis DSM 18603]
MHPFLTRLGVSAEIQAFFQESCMVDVKGNLLFSYGDSTETYGLAFHRVPASGGIWLAGNSDYNLIRQVFVCRSAMDAIAFLSLNYKAFPDFDQLFFVATGLRPCRAQLDWIVANFPHRKIGLLFGNDLLDKITDLKVAAGLHSLFLSVTLSGDTVNVRFLYRDYRFTTDRFSLNQFEKQSGQRFRCRTVKPRRAVSWANQLFQKLAKK